MLSRLRNVIEKLQAGVQGRSPGYCVLPKERPEVCQTMILGSIFNSIGFEGMRHLINADDASHYNSKYAPTGSVSELVGRFKAISVFCVGDRHVPCNPISQLLKEIDRLLAKHESPIEPEHYGHLTKQQQKLGLPAVVVLTKPNRI